MTRRSRRLLALAVLALLPVGLLVAFGRNPTPSETSLRVGLSRAFVVADDAFDRLGAPRGSTLVAPHDIEGPDGNMPRLLTATLATPTDRDAVLDHYRRRCGELGLTVPAELPDALCEGVFRGTFVVVQVDPRCTAGGCETTVRLSGS